MAQHAHLDPSPFFLQGGPTGILMIHGYTGALRERCERVYVAGQTLAWVRQHGG